ncbi:MAG: hypothetical protein HOL74_05030 [Flavobacteriales bacterium]|jgi:hypothetical protein|nr:hypothetical protein [Flavobacteriales bacterium]
MKKNSIDKKRYSLLKIVGALLMFIFILSSCTIQKKLDVSSDEKEKSGMKIVVENTEQKEYIGWWVYGEGQHIFKDEQTLEEYDMEFPNENMEELVELYLAVCEMEYFPMECKMTGHLKKELVEKQTTLIVSDFEILYIQGCGE